MAGQWNIVREQFPLADLEVLAKATDGASRDWVFVEPSVAELEASSRKGKEEETVSRMVTSCTLGADGNRVFAAKDGPSFNDLPSRAANELAKFALEQVKIEEKEDTPEGEEKP